MEQTILMRVLPAGEGRIALGEHCAVTGRQLWLGVGAVFSCPVESGQIYVARAMAERV